MSGIAAAERAGYEIQLNLRGQTVFAHTNFGTPEVQTIELRGLKDTGQSNRRQVVFKFPNQADIFTGTVLQIKGSRDFWKVTDTEDLIHDDTYIYLEAWVEKINEQGTHMRLNAEGKAIFNGPVSGQVQIGGQGNSQSVTITNTTNPDFAAAINSIIGLVRDSSISELDKEDIIADAERLHQLSQKEPSPDVVDRAKKKFDLLKSALEVGELAVKAGPYLALVGKAFGF
jgi:hypothetical protein